MKSFRAGLGVLSCAAIAAAIGACGGDDTAVGGGDASPDAPAAIDAAHADTSTGENDATPDEGGDSHVPDADTSQDAFVADASGSDASHPDANVTDASTPDANLHDADAADTSAPDANAPDARASDASIVDANSPDAKQPDAAVPVRVRLVDLAPFPAGLKADVCAQRQGGPTVTAPLLLGAGGGAIAYPSVSGYVDVAPGLYDLRFVPSSVTDCSATATLGFIGNVSVTATTTLALYQYAFATAAYNAAVFVDAPGSATTLADVRVHNAVLGSAAEDFWQTSDGSSYTLLAAAIAYGGQSLFVPLAAGSHGFEARSSTGAVLATLAPQALAASTSWEGFTFRTSTASQGIVLCSDAPLLPSQSRACLGP